MNSEPLNYQGGHWPCALICAAALASPVLAEVTHSADQGFVVRHKITIHQPAARVYQALTGEIGQWWSSAHTYSGDAANMTLDARAGGCFCEIWTDTHGQRQQVQHLQVVAARPSVSLRLIGGLGPLQQEAVAAVMDWNLTWNEERKETQVTMSYKVNGYRPGGMKDWAGPVNQVLGEQVQGLAQHLGEPIATSTE